MSLLQWSTVNYGPLLVNGTEGAVSIRFNTGPFSSNFCLVLFFLSDPVLVLIHLPVYFPETFSQPLRSPKRRARTLKPPINQSVNAELLLVARKFHALPM